MYNAQSGSGPLYVLDSSDEVVSGSPTGRWLLTSSVTVLDGVTLYVHGASAGGDADVLRIEVPYVFASREKLLHLRYRGSDFREKQENWAKTHR